MPAHFHAERKRQREAKLALGSKWRDSGLVVIDEFGNAPHPDTLTAAWKKGLSNAVLPHVRLRDAHTLIHCAAYPITTAKPDGAAE